MNREERLEQLLTATVKLLDRWEEYSLETNCGGAGGLRRSPRGGTRRIFRTQTD